MRQKEKRFSSLPLMVLAGMLLCAGCQKVDPTPTSTPAGVNPPVAVAPASPSGENTPPSATPTPIKDSLTTLFAREAEDAKSPFPKGTHLLSVDLKGKLATVDVSKEFNGLANRGESMEGLAQKKLCAALAQFAAVDTMRLTVEGKDYESQAADWRSIPVRLDKTASDSPSALQKAGSLDR